MLWLHPAKTGTSFLNTIYHYACSIPETASLEDEFAGAHSIEEHLTARFPPEEYCQGSFAIDEDCHHGAPCWGYGGVAESLGPHRIYGVPPNAHDKLSDAMFEKHGEATVVMLRKPVDRAMSEAMYHEEVNVDDGWAEGNLRYMTNLIGPDLETAKERLRKFAFVGLTEEWELSVKLFHAMFGGKCIPEIETQQLRRGPNEDERAKYGAVLEKLQRLAPGSDDEALHGLAAEIFHERLAEYGLTDSPDCAAWAASVCQSDEGESSPALSTLHTVPFVDPHDSGAFDEDRAGVFITGW
jgi:hypothetical protein